MNKSNKNLIFKIGELFCGPGGLAFGAKESVCNKKNYKYSISHAWASDYDPDSCKTYINNICPKHPESVICKNIHDLDLKSLKSIDAFAYGFPCNDFSLVGEQKGLDGHYGNLYMYGVEVLNIFKPKFFIAENVSGLKSIKNGEIFNKILYDLQNAGNGYNLTVHLYKAEEYEVPQTRHRIIIVGFDKKLKLIFKVPKPTTLEKYITVKEALENPPISDSAFNHEKTQQSNVVVERLKYIKPGENAFTAQLPDDLKLNINGAKLSQIYKRLNPEKPSYTITGSGGGGTHCYHWIEPRALTNRERARIQTFPDNYIFEGSKESVRKQIGMAVPPKLSKIIFNAILMTLAGVEYPCVLPNGMQKINYNKKKDVKWEALQLQL